MQENIITVLVSLGALLLLGVVFGVVFMQYRSGSMRTLLGGVAPPAAGKTTTLLITDIQVSILGGLCTRRCWGQP